MEFRDSYEYRAIHDNEFSSNLLAVWCQVAESLELLHFEKRYHGPYKRKPTKAQRRKKKNRQDSAVAESGKDGEATIRHAYSRILIGRITLKRGVGFLGKTQVVVVVHFNNNVANKNKGFADEQKRLLSDLVALCSEYEASVLMGDFNMIFEMVPVFRSRGKTSISAQGIRGSRPVRR